MWLEKATILPSLQFSQGLGNRSLMLTAMHVSCDIWLITFPVEDSLT